MMRKFLTLITIAAVGSVMAGCVVEPVDGVSVGYGQGVVLHHGGETPNGVAVVQPTVVQPTPVIVEHDHDREHYHEDHYREDRY